MKKCPYCESVIEDRSDDCIVCNYHFNHVSEPKIEDVKPLKRLSRQKYWGLFILLEVVCVIPGFVMYGMHEYWRLSECIICGEFFMRILCFVPRTIMRIRRLNDIKHPKLWAWWSILPIIGWLMLIRLLIEPSKDN